ncbi:MAG TPA: OmpA family protein [Bacteroidales bacterium]|jgi:chemotaxis protein MotB|nr:OmpA family protein [Bacteroidales bacterium]MDI9573769.1 OmpA family protein [Bacteroidota bacterium]OQC61275.1 MAG: putative lipoprotein YiaD precursor [Bacteroidetes bacterium ADurb.Bin012]MBP9511120.1 OmpA family protein [Bacteroidales bacterium]MBP9589161.1 OmpA family protein [Bacteroidales bacterium]
MKSLLKIFVCAIMAIMVSSCVSQKKYTETEQKRRQCEEELIAQKSQNNDLIADNTELKVRLERLNKNFQRLINDTIRIGQNLRDFQADYERLKFSYNELLDIAGKTEAGNKAEIQRIMAELQSSQEKLIHKQDSLQALEAELAVKQKHLNELQKILNQKDSIVNALRQKVSQALLGFEGKGLSIEIRNGKVYVSLEESLLFRSGSWEVNDRGISALQKLAEVLASNPDINVLIEGHTDNVPYRGSGQVKDNWDLSVMRATAIVKVITRNPGVHPSRLTAAGRSEYAPLATNSTSEGRAKNRRTEIILTPKLDELFQIIETH